MTTRQLEEFIALACGWVYQEASSQSGDVGYWISPNGTSWTSPLPYCRDLNAMRQAEELMVGDTPVQGVQQAVFAHELFKVIHPSKNGEGVSEFDKIHATARQRAEALYHTLNRNKR